MTTLTTKQSAAALGISLRLVQLAVKSGTIPATRFGNAWQIDSKDLTRYSPRPVGRPPKKEK